MLYRQSIGGLAILLGGILPTMTACGTPPAPASVPVTVAPLRQGSTALPSTPVGVSMGPGGRGITVGSNGYSGATSVWVTSTGARHWTKVLSVGNLLTTAYWVNRSVQVIWIAGVADRPKPHDPQWFQPVLWHSTDGGRTWTHVMAAVPRAAGFRTKGIAWTHLVWTTPRVGWATTTAGQVLTTGDGGQRWSLVPAFADHAIRQIQFVNRDDGWALSAMPDAGSSILWHTTDGGQRWQHRRLSGQVRNVDFVSADHGWAAGSLQGRHGRWTRAIWSTTDGGRRWGAHDLGRAPNAAYIMAGVIVASPRLLWATAVAPINTPPPGAENQPLAGQLWVSENGGRNWHEVPHPPAVEAIALPQVTGSHTTWMPVLAGHSPMLFPREYVYHWEGARKRWAPLKDT